METVSWAVEHQKILITVGIIVAVVALIVLGTWYYLDQQNQEAGLAMAHAMRTYNAQIAAPGTPAQPGITTFPSIEERARAAQREFRDIASKYSHTHSGEIARYFAAITDLDLGNNKAAEQELKNIGSSHNSDLASLAKLALASAYHADGNETDAIATYKDLINHPTRAVGKSTAELELAGLYADKQQPDEARKLYEQIRKDDPKSAAAETAANKLQGLK